MISYLITEPLYYGTTPFSLTSKLSQATKKNSVDYACLRDKIASNYDELAISFIRKCKELDIKPILHTFFEKVVALGAYGVHFASYDFQKIPQAKKLKIFIIASSHSLEEAQNAISLGADFVTISPIFYMPHKGNPLGLDKLKEITDKIPNRCLALGGILEKNQVKACKKAGAVGFASIRYFLEKGL